MIAKINDFFAFTNENKEYTGNITYYLQETLYFLKDNIDPETYDDVCGLKEVFEGFLIRNCEVLKNNILNNSSAYLTDYPSYGINWFMQYLLNYFHPVGKWADLKIDMTEDAGDTWKTQTWTQFLIYFNYKDKIKRYDYKTEIPCYLLYKGDRVNG